MLLKRILSAGLLYTILLSGVAFGQTAAPKVYEAPKETIDKIRQEGLQRSQVMQTLSYLTDVIGGRLTNSPNMKRANEWTRDEMKKWGMQNAKLEAWGPFGRGWSLKSFSAEVNSPQLIPVIAYPKAWSPSTKGAVTSEVVLFEAKTDADFEKYRGRLKGKIVLVSGIRPLKAQENPLSKRHSESDLEKMASAPAPDNSNSNQFSPDAIKNILNYFNKQARQMKFLMDEGAAVMIDSSSQGSGGTIFVQGASLAIELSPNLKTIEDLFNDAGFQPQRKGAEANMMPQVTLATEDYNRIARMIKLGEKPTMTVNVQVQYHDDDLMGYNTVAEIPGTDPNLKDEVVMLGGHLDSWHSSTGATDNAAGCAVAMEAARILIASGLKPRRTIRVALWSGEEQGLYGSTYYVKQHLGEMKDGKLVKGADYDKISAYYNLDNGTGRIRGVYLQGNAAVKPFFETWLKPFSDFEAKTLTLSNTGGTDHLSFDAIGIPGFQFIQDEIEYDTRTHHSNQDNYDRIQAEDMKQAATIMAAFVYQTAMMDEKLPRKAVK
ncbi:MAG: M20/M25/M40 family metallo-hydrolase [Pyrinomonadaceae bacterium]|nr:M20/M25/M40 family metallo-hydrolase [Pyrinomonadaceae bacterium]